jgi:hypothetical protein
MEEDTFRRVCFTCGTQSPPTASSYTLISARYGWRVRRYEKDAEFITEWYCPTCWVAFKQSETGVRTRSSFPVKKKA